MGKKKIARYSTPDFNTMADVIYYSLGDWDIAKPDHSDALMIHCNKYYCDYVEFAREVMYSLTPEENRMFVQFVLRSEGIL